KLVGLPSGFTEKGKVAHTPRCAALILLLHPGVCHYQPPTIQYEMRNQPIHERAVVSAPGGPVTLVQGRDLRDALGQPVADLYLAPIEVTQEFYIVVAWDAERS